LATIVYLGRDVDKAAEKRVRNTLQRVLLDPEWEGGPIKIKRAEETDVSCDCELTGAILLNDFVLEAIYTGNDSVPAEGQRVVRLNPPPNPRITQAILEGDGVSRRLTDWEIKSLRKETQEAMDRMFKHFRKGIEKDE